MKESSLNFEQGSQLFLKWEIRNGGIVIEEVTREW